MTIEKTHASSEAKPTSAASAKGAKGKTGSADKADASGSGGFMAVLAAIDTSAAPAPASTDTGLDPLESLQLLEPLPPAPSDLVLAPVATPLAPTALGTGADVPMDAMALLAQATQWNPAPAEGAMGQAPGAVKSIAPGGSLPQPAAALAPDLLSPGLATDAATQTLRKPAKGLTDLAAGQAAAGAALVGTAGTNGQADPQVLSKFQRTEAVLTTPSPLETALATAVVSVRREDQGRDHSIFKGNALEAASPPQAAPTGAPATGVITTSAVVPPSEVYVAEQVKYWISNDVKNAEMTLDGIGNSPVEVRISMQGNEAQVDFRTDELRARQVLEDASAHLKDMLNREGLVLSGVSVGTAGTGNSGGQERKPPPGVRQTSVVSAQPAPSHSAPPSIRAPGRALDLFV